VLSGRRRLAVPASRHQLLFPLFSSPILLKFYCVKRRFSITSKYSPCSAELISTAYQPWNSVFLSQQNSHSRLIIKKQPAEQGHWQMHGVLNVDEIKN
jgi:hypothetical protein